MHLHSSGRPPRLLPHGIRRLAGGALLLAVLLAAFPLRVAPVRGASMEPTLHDGQWVCYRTPPWASWGLERGDMVVFRSPVQPELRYVKRAVGLPGDELRFQDGILLVNGEELVLPEGAVPEDMVLSIRVPPGCFYALGDHGNVSFDSRCFGSVPLDRIVGRVITTLGE